MTTRPKIRLYVEHPLAAEQSVQCTQAQANYLFNVMRLSVGAEVAIFNGADGEWRAEVMVAGKRGGVLRCVDQTAPQGRAPDLWLLFAPIKKARTDFIVEKAVELGAAKICPIQTDFTNAERIRQDRLQAHAVEAAEQCGITYVPEVGPLRKLSEVLSGWDTTRRLLFADEARAEGRQQADLSADGEKWAILIGPEGGFSEAERARLRVLPFVTPIALGPRILRADTAAVAALSYWQITHGNW